MNRRSLMKFVASNAVSACLLAGMTDNVINVHAATPSANPLFADSSKPPSGYDCDTLADDLSGLLTQLDLRGVTLVSRSFGGAEVVRLNVDLAGFIKA